MSYQSRLELTRYARALIGHALPESIEAGAIRMPSTLYRKHPSWGRWVNKRSDRFISRCLHVRWIAPGQLPTLEVERGRPGQDPSWFWNLVPGWLSLQERLGGLRDVRGMRSLPLYQGRFILGAERMTQGWFLYLAKQHKRSLEFHTVRELVRA